MSDTVPVRLLEHFVATQQGLLLPLTADEVLKQIRGMNKDPLGSREVEQLLGQRAAQHFFMLRMGDEGYKRIEFTIALEGSAGCHPPQKKEDESLSARI